jgi:hypothetical protein
MRWTRLGIAGIAGIALVQHLYSIKISPNIRLYLSPVQRSLTLGCVVCRTCKLRNTGASRAAPTKESMTAIGCHHHSCPSVRESHHNPVTNRCKRLSHFRGLYIMLHRVTQLVYLCAATLLLSPAVLAYKKYSRLSSSVEVGKGSSKFLSTIGCMTPKLPIC